MACISRALQIAAFLGQPSNGKRSPAMSYDPSWPEIKRYRALQKLFFWLHEKRVRLLRYLPTFQETLQR
jgi:hypothetical protein